MGTRELRRLLRKASREGRESIQLDSDSSAEVAASSGKMARGSRRHQRDLADDGPLSRRREHGEPKKTLVYEKRRRGKS
ncbi:hypothetical protein SDC9_182749 [bioreactor metagenome]|uniref:Uncharacterized protein n=1 Tax=bioreactor metagenome TaxID=1076179 RepID=A0A645HA48_9ZZZZ